MRFSFFTTVAMAAISATTTEALNVDEDWPSPPSILSQVGIVDRWDVEDN